MNRQLAMWMKGIAAVALVAVLLGSGGTANALTIVQFTPVQQVLTNEIATLEANPSQATAQRLRTLLRAQEVLNNSNLEDGRALRSLLSILKGRNYSDYAAPLATVSQNLVNSFNTFYEFTLSVLPEMQPGQEADLANRRVAALAPIAARLNSGDPNRVAALYDSALRRLDAAFFLVSQALIIDRPQLSPNTVAALVNNVRFRTSAGLASANVFSAVRNETGVLITVYGVDGTSSGNTGRRALSFSVQAREGTFTYDIPTEASLTYSTDVYTDNEVAHTATSGRLRVVVTSTDVYGSFEAIGEGFELIRGEFVIDIESETQE